MKNNKHKKLKNVNSIGKISMYLTLRIPCRKIFKKPKMKFKVIITLVLLSKFSNMFIVIFLYFNIKLKINTMKLVNNANGIL